MWYLLPFFHCMCRSHCPVSHLVPKGLPSTGNYTVSNLNAMMYRHVLGTYTYFCVDHLWTLSCTCICTTIFISLVCNFTFRRGRVWSQPFACRRTTREWAASHYASKCLWPQCKIVESIVCLTGGPCCFVKKSLIRSVRTSFPSISQRLLQLLVHWHLFQVKLAWKL